MLVIEHLQDKKVLNGFKSYLKRLSSHNYKHLNNVDDIINDFYILAHDKKLEADDVKGVNAIIGAYLRNKQHWVNVDSKNKYQIKGANSKEWNWSRLEIFEDEVFNEEDSAEEKNLLFTITKNLQETLTDEAFKIFEMYFINNLNMTDIKEITGISLGHIHNITKGLKSIINSIKLNYRYENKER